MPRLRRTAAVLTAATLLVAGCTTRVQRIGLDDGTDSCRPQLVALDSTGNFFAEDIIRGAVVGAAGGAILGGLVAAATGRRGGDVAAGAAIGAAAGGVAGGVGGYLQARQRQAQDQATLSHAIATDLARENAEIERTQHAFDRLMDCRFRQAQSVREAHRQGALPRPAAEAQMAQIRAWTQRDIQLAQTINQRIGTRGAEFDTAMDTVAPGVKDQYQARKATAERRAITAQARQAVPLRLRPDPSAPAVAEVQPRQAVQIRPVQAGFALVETPDGQRGYAPAASFGTRGSGRPVRPGADTAAPAAATAGDVRTLAASNIAQRDNFTESVRNAEAATTGGGFELAS